MKKLLFLIALIIIALFAGCSNNKTVEESTAKDIQTSAVESNIQSTKDDIKQYINSNVDNIEYCSVTLQGKKALIMCVLDKEMQDYKSNYYSFAESVVNSTKKASQKYELKYVNVNVYFFIDSDMSIYWETTDFGKTGTFTDKDDINNYEDIEYYSLSDLKKYLSKYN